MESEKSINSPYSEYVLRSLTYDPVNMATNKYDCLDVAEYILNKYYESLAFAHHSLEAAIVKVNEIQIHKRKANLLNNIVSGFIQRIPNLLSIGSVIE